MRAKLRNRFVVLGGASTAGALLLACSGDVLDTSSFEDAGGSGGAGVGGASEAASAGSGDAGGGVSSTGAAPGAGGAGGASGATSSGAGGGEAEGSGGGGAQGPQLAGRHLLFAAGYTTTKAAQKNTFVLLGHYDFAAGGTAKARYFLYDGNANKPEGVTSLQHPPMNAPYGGDCTQGPVRIPSYAAHKDLAATWKVQGEVLEVQVGSVVHQWERTEPSKGYWQLARDYFDASTGQSVIGGTVFSGSIGMAYEANEARSTTPVTKAQLGGSYKVQIHQNNAVAGSPWVYSTSGLSLASFAASKDPDVLSYSYSCSGGMWCQRTALLNYAPYSSQIFYMNGGHDFNKNGCYDELGHRYQYIGVLDGGLVTKLVFVEYSHEYDGFPILSVGRAYIP